MTEVLVTGGAGFIGSNFVRYAIATHPDWHVTTLDKLTYAGRTENLRDVMNNPRHTFVKGDIADRDVAAPLVRKADYVVHFAAETHVDRSILHAADFITTDVIGTFVLLEAAREARNLKTFVQISTDEVYGSVPEGSSVETDELRPRNPYSASKAGADRCRSTATGRTCATGSTSKITVAASTCCSPRANTARSTTLAAATR
jgi:dTDP-glucose 4,6-dehydratase